MPKVSRSRLFFLLAYLFTLDWHQETYKLRFLIKTVEDGRFALKTNWAFVDLLREGSCYKKFSVWLRFATNLGDLLAMELKLHLLHVKHVYSQLSTSLPWIIIAFTHHEKNGNFLAEILQWKFLAGTKIWVCNYLAIGSQKISDQQNCKRFLPDRPLVVVLVGSTTLKHFKTKIWKHLRQSFFSFWVWQWLPASKNNWRQFEYCWSTPFWKIGFEVPCAWM